MKILAGNATVYNQALKSSNNKTKTTDVEKSNQVSKVDNIKAQIEAGTYKININKTASAMAEALLSGG